MWTWNNTTDYSLVSAAGVLVAFQSDLVLRFQEALHQRNGGWSLPALNARTMPPGTPPAASSFPADTLLGDTERMAAPVSSDVKMQHLITELTEPFDTERATGDVSVQRSPQSALPTLLVKRGRKKIGSYLISHQLLLVGREEDREVATATLAESGFAVRAPLETYSSGDDVVRVNASIVGAWGTVILFDLRLPQPRTSPRVALFDLDSGALCTVSDELLPHLRRSLAAMGLTPRTTSPTATPARLRNKLDWEPELWGWSHIHDGGAFGPPEENGPSIERALTAEAASRVPAAVSEAVNTLLAVPVKDPFYLPASHREMDHPQGYWSHQHGVLDEGQLAKLRRLAQSTGAVPPEGWRRHWDEAVALSPSHAPSLTALALHEAYPQWWASLDISGARDELHGVWLLGHSDKLPGWMRASTTADEEDRFGVAVAAVIAVAGDLSWLVPASLQDQECAMCGRSFSPSQLAAGHVAQLRTADVCHLCVRIWNDPSALNSSPVLQAGAAAAVGEVVRHAGRLVSKSMIPGLVADGAIDPVTMLILRQVLPTATEHAWVDWLASAGVLGDGWRPSMGYITVASDGHACRSVFERYVDDFLSSAGVPHLPEPAYPYDDDLNPHGMRADWMLPGEVFVEAAGLLGQKAYAAKMERKRELADKLGLRLLVLTDADLPHLTERFAAFTDR